MSRIIHTDAESALLPEAFPAYSDLVARGLDHRWVLHVRSSQAFALNLFAPLDDSGVRQVMTHLGHELSHVEPPEFEYCDSSDRLGESSTRSRHQTQVDVVLRGSTATGVRIVSLIEVKLSEIDFGQCSAFGASANDARDVCQSPGLFGGEPQRCFQLANHGHGHRTYADYLEGVQVALPTGSHADGGCLVRRGLNQPMRNLALAHLMLAGDEADRVTYALCAPEAHPTIWRRFDEVALAFPDSPERTIRPLPAGFVAGLHPDGGRGYTAHYPTAVLADLTLSNQRTAN
jgi:hypothetical protein